MANIPPFLKPGDTIAVTCASSKMQREAATYAAGVLEGWGLRTILGKTVGTAWNNFSATDEERKNELQLFLDDPQVNAILFGRGGYGMVRILDGLDLERFSKAPKWLAGYSDITTLLTHVYATLGIPSIHSPMCSAITPETVNAPQIRMLKDMLFGKPATYKVAADPLNLQGSCSGILIGGNLSLLVNLSGTISRPDTHGKILLLEDTGEYRYVIDRMMHNLRRSGWLEPLAGMIVGSFTDFRDTDTPFGQTEQGLIREMVKDYGFPVAFGFPSGHQVDNYPLKIGGLHELSVTPQGCLMKEIS
jgi:muramoyltetrapeptide carboxypeptidase